MDIEISVGYAFDVRIQISVFTILILAGWTAGWGDVVEIFGVQLFQVVGVIWRATEPVGRGLAYWEWALTCLR
jgi:hypothetical protein